MADKVLKNPIKEVKIEQNEQLKTVDFQNIASYPFLALKNVLSIIFGMQSGKIEGLDLIIKDGYVYAGPGFGIVTNVDADDESKVDGTYIINNTEETALFQLPSMPIGTVISVYLTSQIIDEDLQKRNFIKNDNTYEVKDIWTTKKYTFGNGYDINTLYPDPIYNKLILGNISYGSNNVITVNNKTVTPLTLFSHKKANPIDHPDGSIHATHLSNELSGGFQEGSDLSLKAMSWILTTLKGNTTSPNERISTVIDENGDVVTSAVEDIVESLIQSKMSGITDGQGNFSKKAMNASDEQGRPLFNQIGVASGQVHGDDGRMTIPQGFTAAQTHFIVSIAQVSYPVYEGSYVELHCEVSEPNICKCYAIVNGNSTQKYYGVANYLAVAIKPTTQ